METSEGAFLFRGPRLNAGSLEAAYFISGNQDAFRKLKYKTVQKSDAC